MTLAPELVFDGGQAGIKEEEAHHATWQYAPVANPGLLQTPAYATRVAGCLPHLSSHRDTHCEMRMERGRQMRDRSHLQHRFVLGAGVHDRPGPLMDEQRAHWRSLHAHDHIQIRVLGEERSLISPTGFTLRGGASWMEVGDLYFQAPGDLQSYVQEWERVWDQAVPLDLYQRNR